MPTLERIRVVLLRPRGAANVGAVARAMKNMGLARLVLVDPPRLDREQARVMAVHAADVLAARAEVASLAAAVADCGLVVGTCGRPSVRAEGALSPRALAPQILAASAVNDVALVFGPEDHGLSNDDLALCQQVIAIPASAEYGSLNLAQAVLVCAYELFLAAAAPAGAAAGATPATSGTAAHAAPVPALSSASAERAPRRLAVSARTELMYDKLEAALRRIDFLQPDSAAHVMRDLRRTLGRAELDDDEVQVFLGIARQIEWAATAPR
jgi:TrmH family RNA methyltransferase